MGPDHPEPRRQMTPESRVHHHEQVRDPVWPEDADDRFQPVEPHHQAERFGPPARPPVHEAQRPHAPDTRRPMPPAAERRTEPWPDLRGEAEPSGEAQRPPQGTVHGPHRPYEPALRAMDRPAPPSSEHPAPRRALHLGPFAPPTGEPEPHAPMPPAPWGAPEPHGDHPAPHDRQEPTEDDAPAAPWARRATGPGWHGQDPFEMMEEEGGDHRPRPPEPLRHGPPEQYLPPHLRSEPRLTGQAPSAAPVLSRGDVHRLQATLYELSECRRLMSDALGPHDGPAPQE